MFPSEIFMEYISMRKPLIILTARSHPMYGDSRGLTDVDAYFEYVLAGGGLPVMAAAFTRENAVQYAEEADGLLITGGEDVDPARYGAVNTHSELCDRDIEESDFLLYEAFKEAHKPILGICRGIQVIAAAEGLPLIQDIPSCGCYHSHYQSRMNPPVGMGKTAHTCTFVPGTLMYSIFGGTGDVNSYHHQGFTGAPKGFVISAISDDGLTEAIEKDRITAVQWHPERLPDDHRHCSIIRAFIGQCLLG